MFVQCETEVVACLVLDVLNFVRERVNVADLQGDDIVAAVDAIFT